MQCAACPSESKLCDPDCRSFKPELWQVSAEGLHKSCAEVTQPVQGGVQAAKEMRRRGRGKRGSGARQSAKCGRLSAGAPGADPFAKQQPASGGASFCAQPQSESPVQRKPSTGFWIGDLTCIEFLGASEPGTLAKSYFGDEGTRSTAPVGDPDLDGSFAWLVVKAEASLECHRPLPESRRRRCVGPYRVLVERLSFFARVVSLFGVVTFMDAEPAQREAP